MIHKPSFSDALRYAPAAAVLGRRRTRSAGGGGAPADDLYLMSGEATDAFTVLADDFRRANWFLKNADDNAAAGTPWQLFLPGWGGNLSATASGPITPTGAVIDLNALGKKPLFATSNYFGTTGVIDPSTMNQRNNAWHNLSGGGSGGYSELYFRFYMFFVPANYYGAGNPSADYVFGPQKVFTINKWNATGGIDWTCLGFNIGSGGGISTGTLGITDNHGTSSIWTQNQGNTIACVPGKWYFAEGHIKLNTNGNADGVWELWINDGGSTGDFSAQSPTLRARHTNVTWGYTTSDTQLMANVWPENWSPNDTFPSSSGEQFWGNLHVKTAGPIGFARAA